MKKVRICCGGGGRGRRKRDPAVLHLLSSSPLFDPLSAKTSSDSSAPSIYPVGAKKLRRRREGKETARDGAREKERRGFSKAEGSEKGGRGGGGRERR